MLREVERRRGGLNERHVGDQIRQRQPAFTRLCRGVRRHLRRQIERGGAQARGSHLERVSRGAGCQLQEAARRLAARTCRGRGAGSRIRPRSRGSRRRGRTGPARRTRPRGCSWATRRRAGGPAGARPGRRGSGRSSRDLGSTTKSISSSGICPISGVDSAGPTSADTTASRPRISSFTPTTQGTVSTRSSAYRTLRCPRTGRPRRSTASAGKHQRGCAGVHQRFDLDGPDLRRVEASREGEREIVVVGELDVFHDLTHAPSSAVRTTRCLALARKCATGRIPGARAYHRDRFIALRRAHQHAPGRFGVERHGLVECAEHAVDGEPPARATRASRSARE